MNMPCEKKEVFLLLMEEKDTCGAMALLMEQGLPIREAAAYIVSIEFPEQHGSCGQPEQASDIEPALD